MRYPKLRELREAIKSLFSRPYTSKFPYAPSVPPPKFRGKPQFYKEDCVGCAACAQVCPVGCIDVSDNKDSRQRKLTLHLDICIFCGNCQENCITEKGTRLGSEYDLATFDRTKSIEEVEKELIFCEDCSELIGPKDHLVFLARRIGPLAYGNPLLVTGLQAQLGLTPAPTSETVQPSRTSIFRILCPKCRREILLSDEYGSPPE